MTPERTKKRYTLRRLQLMLVAGITIVLALVYTLLVYQLYSGGLNDALQITFNLDARGYERLHQQNPDTPLPSTPQHPVYLGWEQVPADYQRLFNAQRHEVLTLHEGTLNIDTSKTYEQLVALDAHFLLMYAYPMYNGQVLYMFADVELALLSEQEALKFGDKLDFTIPLGLVLLLSVLLLAHLFNQRIARATNKLANWADQLTLDTLDSHPPDFNFDELNRVADRLQQALHRIGKLLNREHQFLRNASHELRTPIAITSANLDYLSRVGVPDTLLKPVTRIQRANHSMKHLTETLLWLSRENDTLPLQQHMTLADQVAQQCEDLTYLLEGKQVQVTQQIPAHTQVTVPPMALQIVLHNLIRNAFQHTHEGAVSIRLIGDELVICNHDSEPQGVDHPESIGLGLTLVRQMCARLTWRFNITANAHGVEVKIQLPTAT